MDWLALWGLNVGLRSFDVSVGQEVVVGRLYAVQEGDTLARIAAEMGTGVDVIRRLNYDFADQVYSRTAVHAVNKYTRQCCE